MPSRRAKGLSQTDIAEKEVEVECKEVSERAPAPTQKDQAYKVLGDAAVPVEMTMEENQVVLRKIDLWLMPIIVMVYFLQQLDKCVHAVECSHYLCC